MLSPVLPFLPAHRHFFLVSSSDIFEILGIGSSPLFPHSSVLPFLPAHGHFFPISSSDIFEILTTGSCPLSPPSLLVFPSLHTVTSFPSSLPLLHTRFWLQVPPSLSSLPPVVPFLPPHSHSLPQDRFFICILSFVQSPRALLHAFTVFRPCYLFPSLSYLVTLSVPFFLPSATPSYLSFSVHLLSLVV